VFWTQLINSMYLLDAGITMMNCNFKMWLISNKYPSLLCTYTWNE